MGILFSHKGTQGIFLPLLTQDGRVNVEAMNAYARELTAKVAAEKSTDYDTVAAEMTALLLTMPACKSRKLALLIQQMETRRHVTGFYAGKTQEEQDAAFARLTEVVPNFLRSKPEQFHVGKKIGVAIRFVAGEIVRDANGDPTYDRVSGDEIQAFRHSDVDWAVVTKPTASQIKAREAAELAAKALAAAERARIEAENDAQ